MEDLDDEIPDLVAIDETISKLEPSDSVKVPLTVITGFLGYFVIFILFSLIYFN